MANRRSPPAPGPTTPSGAAPLRHTPAPARPAGRGTAESRAAEYVRRRHGEFAAAAAAYRRLYYGSRLAAGACAALLPFVAARSAAVASALAVAVAVMAVADRVFEFGRRMHLYARATSVLVGERLKRTGEYDVYAELLARIERVDEGLRERLVPVDAVTTREPIGPKES